MPDANSDLIKGPSKVLMVLGSILFVKVMFFPEKLFQMGFLHMRIEIFLALFLFAIAFVGGAMWDQMKYRSKKLVGYGLSGSLYTDDVHRIGDWVVALRGGIEVTGFNQHGREGIAVFPGIGFEWMEKNLLAKGVFVEVDKERLPRLVREYIEKEDLPTNSIMMALAPTEIEHHNKVFISWMQEYGDLNALKKAKEKMTEEVMERSQDIVEWKKDTKKSSAEGAIQRLTEKLDKDNNGE